MKNKDLTVGQPGRVLLSYCLPLLASVLFQQLYNIADSFVAGKFIHNDALAAVGNSYEITLIFIAVSTGCNIGCSVVVAQLFGAKRYRDLKTAVYSTLIAGGVICLVFMAAGLALSGWLLTVIHTPANIYDDSKLYLNIYILGLPFVLFYNISTGIFSALGDSKTPFCFLACSSISNIAVDILFVKGFGMGVDGVAWATFLCQGVSCLLAFTVMLRRLKRIPSEGKAAVFSWPILGEVGKIALPSILQQSFVSVGNIVIQSVINSFGSAVIAGYAAAVKLNNMVVTSLLTMANGVSNFTAQNYGAEKEKRIRKGFIAGLRMELVIAVLVSALYLIGGRWLIGSFLEDPSGTAMQVGLDFLHIVAPFYFVIVLKLISDAVLRGMGHMKEFMTDTFFDLFLRVVLAIVLSKTALGPKGIWLSWPIGWILSARLAYFFYRRIKLEKE